ncbi:DNA polymerase III subunit delta [Pseudodonghicola xiamenensis]|uniref:DNA-directed DNA polymerase n=1 Tax=Pseudodonghicola xiamenensis TaxID=337702 RepID=A0A8J3MB89_9RHOB|nr:DNA polymerase III subunit delta [Pseudodonghicola xiamenensis]GHG82269.1 DNA polymerase III subunit delta [Pseudodonghicola xiamenensis]
MKLSAREAERYFAKPEAGRAGLLIYGADTMRVALKRQQVLKALLGEAAEEEMRLSRLQGGELRKDPAQLLDAVKAVGFFPGARAVFVEDATDTIAAAVSAALEDWAPGDAQIVVAAGSLKATSKLRKAFELHPNAYAMGLYDDPPSREEIERTLADAGMRDVPRDSMSALTDLANALGPGDFARLTEKIALYKFQDQSPLSLEDIAACAPRSTEAALDDMFDVVAEGRSQEIGPLLRRLQAQGTNAVSLCIGATRHFRTLYTAAADPGGPASGVGRLRPPVYGKRRDRIVRQAQGWGAMRLESALTLLTDTDLQLRSAQQTAPAMALMERTLIRLAMMGRR